MTTQDLRKEINKVIQKVPDELLEEVLSYLKKFEKASKKNYESVNHLKQILKEDQELLDRLAK